MKLPTNSCKLKNSLKVESNHKGLDLCLNYQKIISLVNDLDFNITFEKALVYSLEVLNKTANAQLLL